MRPERSIKTQLFATALVLAVSACGSSGLRNGRLAGWNGAGEQEVGVRQSRLKFHARCPVSNIGRDVNLDDSNRGLGLGGLLLTTLAPSLVSSGVNFFSERASRKAEQQSAEYRSRTDIKMYGLSRTRGSSQDTASTEVTLRHHCMSFTRGAFGTNTDVESFPKVGEADLENGVADWRLFADDFGLLAPPDMYVEFLIDYNKIPGALQLVPVYLEFNKSAIKGRSRGARKIVSLVFTFSPIIKQGTGSDQPVKVVVPPIELVEGTVMSGELLAYYASDFQPVPAPAKVKSERVLPNGSTETFEYQSFAPMSVQAEVIETDDPSTMSKLLAEALTGFGKTTEESLVPLLQDYLGERLSE